MNPLDNDIKFNAVWSGEHCKNCKRKEYCGVPITKQVKKTK